MIVSCRTLSGSRSGIYSSYIALAEHWSGSEIRSGKHKQSVRDLPGNQVVVMGGGG